MSQKTAQSSTRPTESATEAVASEINESVDDSTTTYALAQIRANFYPKFENEDPKNKKIRMRMIEIVSEGLATLEVTLKHSGSLFMYAGRRGGAYSKNSLGNKYTAVGVFVLGRMFREAWGTEAAKKEEDFIDYLEMSRICISMELVTAVLGDHGQRPQDDYVVVTAVTEYANGKPKFYSTPEIIAFCRKWRLPTNHVWLFSTRKSVTSFFAAFDALCEEGTATTVCNALDKVSDISVPGSKNHMKVQGEILEGLVARIVSRDSSKHVEQVLKDHPPPPNDGDGLDLGPSLREIFASNKSDKKQQIKVLLQSGGSSFCPDHSDWSLIKSVDANTKIDDDSVLLKFLKAHPADLSTNKVQEVVRLMRDEKMQADASFKCYHILHKLDSVSSDNMFFKMVIHVYNDNTFSKYQKEMRTKSDLWPLYRGFFVDINLFKASKEKAAEIAMNHNIAGNVNGDGIDGLTDEEANLMIKLKFLTYKVRTFLIRKGLPTLFNQGTNDYKKYYKSQMEKWGISDAKKSEISKMLDEWAVYVLGKGKEPPPSTYLTEFESFLEQYAKHSPQNHLLVGFAGGQVQVEDFLTTVERGRHGESDLETDRAMASPSSSASVKETIQNNEGLIVFFPGIPGCAKSALCSELLKAPGGLGDDRPVHSLMGDLIKKNKEKYWKKVADECSGKPNSIMLSDKNAPNKQVWEQIQDICRSCGSIAVPVVPDSEGTDSNPFCLEALSVFMFRVLGRVNHPGNLDKSCSNVGNVLLKFYWLYDGKNRERFEGELIQRFGSLVKMPVLRSDRSPLLESVRSVLEDGINLFKLHYSRRHKGLKSVKGPSYAMEWTKWEKRLRDTLLDNAEYLNSIQVPFEFAVKQVLEQLKHIANRDYGPQRSIVFAAVKFRLSDIQGLFNTLAHKNRQVEAFLKSKHECLESAHVTLAHKNCHDIAVADYEIFIGKSVSVEFNAFLFTDKMGALEAQLGSVDGEQIVSKNEWPHLTVWTARGVPLKEANRLPRLLSEGKATRVDINPPITFEGVVEFD